MLVTQSTLMGGMEMHVQYLAAELHARDIRVCMVLPTALAFDDLAQRCQSLGAEMHRADTDDRNGRIAQFRSWLRLIWWARRRRPDVVHFHTGGATGGFVVALISRCVLRATVVRTEHDVPQTAPGLRLRLSSRATDACCHAVVAVSRRNAAIRSERLRAPRHFAAVLNGVPIPASTNRQGVLGTARDVLGIEPKEVVVGTVVRLADGKGVDDLIRAFSLVRGRTPSRLLIVGDGPLRPELERLVRSLSLASQVTFAGHQVDPGRFFNAMNLFVLAVPTGSMSIALLEAMARGLPSVITFGGPEEAVIDGQTGRTAPPHDPEGLGIVLSDLINDPSERERLGRAGLDHVMLNLSASRVAEDLIAVYTTARARGIPAHLRVEALPEVGI